MPSGDVTNVVYDGLCLFCIRSLRVVRALDVRKALRFYDANDRAAVLAELPELRGVDLDAEMFVVDAKRRVYGGYFAFRRIARTTPFGWVLLPLLYFPGVAWAGSRVYAHVARNRSRFGCRVDPGGSG